jgi:DNA polymerase elongation subunit (family B)
MDNEYFVIDIETCPIDFGKCDALTDEEEKKKLINPIDSKIVAIGIRHKGNNIIFSNKDEKGLLEDFWSEWKTIKKGSSYMKIVGFNITNFDIPFLVARSVINNVVISPFFIKELIDLRDKINAYRYGNTRGTLKEYASLLGEKVMDVDGSDIFNLCKDGKMKELVEYLENDLLITDKLYQRVCETNAIQINKW